MRKGFALTILIIIIFSLSAGCSGTSKDKGSGKVHAVTYDGISTLETLNEIRGYTSAATNNNATDRGIVVSPYYTLSVNGESIPVYGTRTTNGIHSFAYADVASVKADQTFSLQVKLTVLAGASVLDKPNPQVVILPESTSVTAKIKGREVSANIADTGSFSFAFNKSYTEPFTLFVARYTELSVPEGYRTVDIEPGEHNTESTNLSQSKTVYTFKSGRHKTDSIILPSDSVLYLERGAYIEVMPMTANGYAIRSTGSNVTVTGRGLIDLSACSGGDVSGKKSGLSFSGGKNILVEGVTIINSQTWTLTFNNCENVTVRNNMLYGYRVYSDGIMLSDSRNGLVEDCFVRTGDDAVEVKSAALDGYTDNILFQRCAVWTDKASAYGAIYETNRDIKNVTFKNCSVGFALQSSINAGTMVIQQGRTPNTKIHDIYFEDIEIFTTYNPVMNITIRAYGGNSIYGNIYDIYFKNITVKNNVGATVLNVRSDKPSTEHIGAIYLDNVITNDNLFTAEAVTTSAVKSHGGWDLSNVKVNTLS